ncbi:MAG TPA: cation diffusion facilitator family transporter [Armatimonadota bacterium]
MLALRDRLSQQRLKAWWGSLLGLSESRHIAQERERSIRMGWILGLLSIAPDIAATYLTGSVAMLTDVFRTGTDTLASFLSWLTVRKIAHGKTVKYNYGYGKLESLASLAVAGAMTLSFLVIIFCAFERFRAPQLLNVENTTYAIIVPIVAGLTNAWCWRRNYRLARRQPSPIMESQWRLFRAKTMINLCVLCALAFSLLFHQFKWSVYIDPVASLLLASFLLFSSYQIVSMSIYDLLDRALEESLRLTIERTLTLFAGRFRALHGVRSRRSGSHIYLEIFVEFDGDSRMADVQQLIEEMVIYLESKIQGSQIVIIPSTSSLLLELTDSPAPACLPVA